MSINILTIPMLGGGLSHQIPLFVLNQLHFQRIDGLKNYFLLPKHLHNSFNKGNITVLPFDYGVTDINNGLKIGAEIARTFLDIEKQACYRTSPEVIIEDCCFTSPLIAEIRGIPRISIHRTGFFRTIDISKRNKAHSHSLEKGSKLSFLDNDDSVDSKKNNLLLNYLNSKTKIIPGIPSIEKLPDNIENRDSFFYSGPLLLDDNLSDHTLMENINRFLKLNASRKKVFITTGLISEVDISNFINILLQRGYAVFSTNNVDVKEAFKAQFFTNTFFPLNFICSNVDLVIHQCGSGMYHYPILNKVPTITIGTRCYDREDVALRLEELNISKHVPSSIDNESYIEMFQNHLTDFEVSNLCDFKALEEINNEVIHYMKKFNPIEVLEYSFNTINR